MAGQDYNIPLDAPMEIESDYTVVNASSPTMLAKPMQKYNNLLGNSVKYENDGWFVEWKRITIENKINQSLEIEPADFSETKVYRKGDTFVLRFTNGLQMGVNFSPRQLEDGFHIERVPAGVITFDPPHARDILKITIDNFNDELIYIYLDANTFTVVDVCNATGISIKHRIEVLTAFESNAVTITILTVNNKMDYYKYWKPYSFWRTWEGKVLSEIEDVSTYTRELDTSIYNKILQDDGMLSFLPSAYGTMFNVRGIESDVTFNNVTKMQSALFDVQTTAPLNMTVQFEEKVYSAYIGSVIPDDSDKNKDKMIVFSVVKSNDNMIKHPKFTATVGVIGINTDVEVEWIIGWKQTVTEQAFVAAVPEVGHNDPDTGAWIVDTPRVPEVPHQYKYDIEYNFGGIDSSMFSDMVNSVSPYPGHLIFIEQETVTVNPSTGASTSTWNIISKPAGNGPYYIVKMDSDNSLSCYHPNGKIYATLAVTTPLPHNGSKATVAPVVATQQNGTPYTTGGSSGWFGGLFGGSSGTTVTPNMMTSTTEQEGDVVAVKTTRKMHAIVPTFTFAIKVLVYYDQLVMIEDETSGSPVFQKECVCSTVSNGEATITLLINPELKTDISTLKFKVSLVQRKAMFPKTAVLLDGFRYLGINYPVTIQVGDIRTPTPSNSNLNLDFEDAYDANSDDTTWTADNHVNRNYFGIKVTIKGITYNEVTDAYDDLVLVMGTKKALTYKKDDPLMQFYCLDDPFYDAQVPGHAGDSYKRIQKQSNTVFENYSVNFSLDIMSIYRKYKVYWRPFLIENTYGLCDYMTLLSVDDDGVKIHLANGDEITILKEASSNPKYVASSEDDQDNRLQIPNPNNPLPDMIDNPYYRLKTGMIRQYLYKGQRMVGEFDPIGTYKVNKGVDKYRFVSATPYEIKFQYKYLNEDGTDNWVDYTVTIPNDLETYVAWDSEDIRTRDVQKLRAYQDQDYIVCQSHWNDDKEQDCWVIDEDTLIIKHYNDRVSLWKKKYDAPEKPTQGVFTTFVWEKAGDVQWSSWNMTMRYGCSDAVEDLPFIWTLDYAEEDLILRFVTAPTTMEEMEDPKWITIKILINSADTPTSYSKGTKEQLWNLPPRLTGEQFWNLSKLSATNKNGELWFGIAADKVLKQWTLKINPTLKKITSVVTGFGFVGIDGTLTGGQWPSNQVDTTNGIIFDLKEAVTGEGKANENAEVYKALDYQGAFYMGGACYFIKDFEELCIGINRSNRRILIPAVQSHDYFKIEADTALHEDSITKSVTLGKNIYIASLSRNGTMSTAYSELMSSSWKCLNDISKGETQFRICRHAHKAPNLGTFDYMLAAFGAGLAGSASNALRSDDPLKVINEDGPNILADTAKEISDLTDRLSTDTKEQSAWLNMSDFYCLANASKIWAGKGFVQTQMVKTAALCASGLSAYRDTEEGIGIDPLKFIFIPGLIFGMANGPSSYFHIFGPPQLEGYSSGLTSATAGKQLPYRKYGYSHRYWNYPTKDYFTHDVDDFGVVCASVRVNGFGSDKWATSYNKPDSYGLLYAQSVTDRLSLIEGSMLPIGSDGSTIMDKPKRSDKGNDVVVFSDPFLYDYCVFPETDLWYTATAGEIAWVSVKDTKVLDGPPSNVVIKNNNTYIGSPYCALEILDKDLYDINFLRPKAVTPQTLLINQTGINCIHGERIYHACDAYGNRIINARGFSGMDIEEQVSISTYRADDDFKISSINPPMSVFGKFASPFGVQYEWLIEHNTPFYKSLNADSESKDVFRFSIPVVYNRMAILPAVMKTLAAYKLNVTEGVTALCTELRSTTANARRPDALDFAVYGQIYRWNPEYISEIVNKMGAQDIKDLVATIGYKYVGSTPSEAWFYSEAIRSFAKFSPPSMQKDQRADRYRDIIHGTYDFVQQEVVLRVDTKDGQLLARLHDGDVMGEIPFPNETIGPFEFYSMAGGMTFQGRRRFQISRFLITDPMVDDIKENANKWKKVKGGKGKDFWSKRDYGWEFDHQEAFQHPVFVERWFLEPFRFATAFLGMEDWQESKFEWLINFAVSDILLSLMGNKYVTVYLYAETMTVGGVVESEVTRIRLHKKMFVRQGQYGYYSYKFNANNGLGDSERLFFWSDGPVFIRSIKMVGNGMTTKRVSPFENYEETKGMEEV